MLDAYKDAAVMNSRKITELREAGFKRLRAEVDQQLKDAQQANMTVAQVRSTRANIEGKSLSPRL